MLWEWLATIDVGEGLLEFREMLNPHQAFAQAGTRPEASGVPAAVLAEGQHGLPLTEPIHEHLRVFDHEIGHLAKSRRRLLLTSHERVREISE